MNDIMNDIVNGPLCTLPVRVKLHNAQTNNNTILFLLFVSSKGFVLDFEVPVYKLENNNQSYFKLKIFRQNVFNISISVY